MSQHVGSGTRDVNKAGKVLCCSVGNGSIVGVALVVALGAGGCTGDSHPDGSDSEDVDGLQESVDGSAEDHSNPIHAGVEGVDITVLNAAAPYDHETMVDHSVVGRTLSYEFERSMIECLQAEGYSEDSPSEPDINREEAVHAANLEFPNIKALARDGLRIQQAQDELSFLLYTDKLMFDADGDESEIELVAERYGKMYVQCGRELFEERERMRSGERRQAFLNDHVDTLRQVSAFLYGEGDGN